jgi:hypothetical protein
MKRKDGIVRTVVMTETEFRQIRKAVKDLINAGDAVCHANYSENIREFYNRADILNSLLDSVKFKKTDNE